LPFRPFAVPVAFVPLGLEIEPPEAFDAWLAAAMEDARG
jgi:hypothetical protein